MSDLSQPIPELSPGGRPTLRSAKLANSIIRTCNAVRRMRGADGSGLTVTVSDGNIIIDPGPAGDGSGTSIIPLTIVSESSDSLTCTNDLGETVICAKPYEFRAAPTTDGTQASGLIYPAYHVNDIIQAADVGDTGVVSVTYIDVNSEGRSILSNHIVLPEDPLDITSGFYSYGFPGLTLDVRTCGQPIYTNNIATTPVATSSHPTPQDNTDLTAPNEEVIFLAERDNVNAGVLKSFIRLTPKDIGAHPGSGDRNIGMWPQKIYTGEGCDKRNYRWFVCSPLYQDL